MNMKRYISICFFHIHVGSERGEIVIGLKIIIKKEMK
jgi:hypothetical protein